MRVLLLIAFLLFVSTAFRSGWTRLSTDFPNYYTAAVAVREHKQLRNFYDWTWFAGEMNYAGIENQLGAYAAQTPLTMLPLLPLSGLTPITAKRVWLVLNLVLLAAVVVMLARCTNLWWEGIAFLLVCGYSSLASNFVYGQYYVFLLFLLTFMFYLFTKSSAGRGGFVAGLAAGMKLYTAPLLIYFAAKRSWAAAAGMLAAVACSGAIAVTLFGPGDVLYYLTHVLPRTLEGGSIDPYNPGVPTLSTLLHRLFLREPELNPHPVLDSPWLFFVLRTALQLSIVAFTALGLAAGRSSNLRRDFAWAIISLVLLSTSTASYTFILLLLPIALLIETTSIWKSAYFAATYTLVCANLKPAWLFPKLWPLVILYIVVGVSHWRAVRGWPAVSVAVAVLALSWADARLRMSEYVKEPGRSYSHIAAEEGALFSGYPAITRSGLFFQAMGDYRKGQDRYVLRWLHGDRIETVAFQGSVLHPVAVDGELLVDLVASRASRTMRFDPAGASAAPTPRQDRQEAASAVSPDGKWTVYAKSSPVGQELWLQESATRKARLLAGGACNNSSPAWALDSSAIIFASDCDRAFGLPALYRAPLSAPR